MYLLKRITLIVTNEYYICYKGLLVTKEYLDHLPVCIAWDPRCTAISAEEQAVSRVRHGPWRL